MNEEKLNKGYLFSGREKVKIDWENIPLSEYPRPNLIRDSYLCLNGQWDIAISEDETLPLLFEDRVMVPYAVESPLSGVNHLLEPDEILYYHRIVTLPKDFRKQQLILHFDGVDQIADIYIDRKKVFSHIGGYTKFSLLIPPDVPSTFDLIVAVKDVSDSSYHTRGKQALTTTGWFYTTSSGIYKPVWLESVPSAFIEDVKFYPDYDGKTVTVLVKAEKDLPVKVHILKDTYDLKSNERKTLPLSEFHPWSPEDPYLYDVRVEMGEDSVFSYFGLRKIEIRQDDKGFRRLYLNGKKIFLSGLLDQGYYYLGNLTPLSYADYHQELIAIKKLGFNLVRVHVKTENDLFYSYADELGLLLIQDFPNGGTSYRLWDVVSPRTFPFLSKEKNVTYEKLNRVDEEGREEYLAEAHQYLSDFNNYPSIIIYTLFNEGWGEFDPSKIYHEMKALESYRLFDTASGWYDADSDFYSIHTYTTPGAKRVDKKKRCFLISEMGGISLKVKDHSYFPGLFGHGTVTTAEALEKKFRKLYLEKFLPQIRKYGLCGLVYTEVADCETEYNGLYTFDREVLKIPEKTIQEVNQALQDEIQK
jgi:beta-galactosidase/beta-glucuronidase